jgi:hypothetical protein
METAQFQQNFFFNFNFIFQNMLKVRKITCSSRTHLLVDLDRIFKVHYGDNFSLSFRSINVFLVSRSSERGMKTGCCWRKGWNGQNVETL